MKPTSTITQTELLLLGNLKPQQLFKFRGVTYRKIYAVEKSPLIAMQNPVCVQDIKGSYTLLEGNSLCAVIDE